MAMRFDSDDPVSYNILGKSLGENIIAQSV